MTINGAYISWKRAAVILASVIMLGLTTMLTASLAWKNEVDAKIELKMDKVAHDKDMQKVQEQMSRIENKIDVMNEAMLKLIGQHEAEYERERNARKVR